MEQQFLKKIHRAEEVQAMETCGFILRDSVIPKGKIHPLHWHDYFELELVVSGRIDYTYNDTHFNAGRGSCFLVSYYGLHSLRNITDARVVNIRFNKNALDSAFHQTLSLCTGQLDCVFNEEELTRLLGYITQLQEEKDPQTPYYKIMRRSLMNEILILFLRKANVTAEPKNESLIQAAIAFIQKNFYKKINLVDVAGSLAVSPNYLGSLIKSCVGMNFNEYLNRLRLRHACTLLSVTNQSIKQIALNSGYASVEYFLYVFKKHLHTTPRAYRSLSEGMIEPS